MTSKYYVQLDVEATYPDSRCDQFYADNPFDTIDEAKKFVKTVRNNGSVIYVCEANILKPILRRWRWEDAWEEVTS